MRMRLILMPGVRPFLLPLAPIVLKTTKNFPKLFYSHQQHLNLSHTYPHSFLLHTSLYCRTSFHTAQPAHPTTTLATPATLATMQTLPARTAAETRALELLGQGVPQEQVALALGITPSAVSQMMAQEDFAAAVQEARYLNLADKNKRDGTLDTLEDAAIEKLKGLMDLVMKPMEAARILQVINGAKRRGSSAPEHVTNTREVVNLTLPIAVVNQFKITTTADNRVVSAGTQELVTIQSSRVSNLLAAAQTAGKGNENDGTHAKRALTNSASSRANGGNQKAIDFDF